MLSDYLHELSRRYPLPPDAPVDPLQPLLVKYREFRATSLLDGATAAAGLTVDELRAGHIDPLVAKAIHSTNPTFDASGWHSDAEWQGIINAAKGKYFEYWVEDQLNHGHAVGDVLLPDGYYAKVAEALNQPGWDLQIRDAAGVVQDYLQLKVTDNTAYIHEALTRYPEIKILATSEAASHLGSNDMVLDAAMTEDQLRQSVEVALDDHGSILGEFWSYFHPVLPLLVIASMHGYKVAVGKQRVNDAVEVAVARAQRALVTTSVGALAKVMGLGWFSIPAALLAGYWVTESQTIDQLAGHLRRQSQMLALQGQRYRLLVQQS